ncbi:uncharacterized protein LOC110978261 isoform X2 [Acanthaster planci]|nr:uncharacterized protein LOC110978261 isoform X2 [Acanthaster planci]
MNSVSYTLYMWIIMAGLLLGPVLGLRGKSHTIENLVTEYLRDEGQLQIEGRTIVYKATVREFAFPVVYDATATDTATGITAITSESESFDDPQDAYHKAVANLLAILRQRGLMKNMNSKNKQESVETSEPKTEQPGQRQKDQEKPANDKTPGGGSNGERETKSPVPDPGITGSRKDEANSEMNLTSEEGSVSQPEEKSDEVQSGKSDEHSERETETGTVDEEGHLNGTGSARDLLQTIITVIIMVAALEWLEFPPWIVVSIGSIGVLLVGSTCYGLLGLNVFKDGFVSLLAFVAVEMIQAGLKRLVNMWNRVAPFALNQTKSPGIPNQFLRTAGLLFEVKPDNLGLYTDHKMKAAAVFDTRKTYKLWSKCKGLAFILNNRNFPQSHLQRKGSEIDVENVKHLFTELGYEIISYDDLTGQEITRRFKDYASSFNKKGAEYDSAVVVLMSHGDEGLIYGIDLAVVRLKALQRELEADNCPGLKDKPKLYFVQACNGKLTTALPVVKDGPNASSVDQGPIQHYHEIPQVQPDNIDDRYLRDLADVHIAYCTTEGYYSLRSETIGSFFIQALCEVFFANAHRDNLDTLMNMVTDRVNDMRGKLFDPATKRWILVNQTPQCKKTLRKALYFFPKYFKNE